MGMMKQLLIRAQEGDQEAQRIIDNLNQDQKHITENARYCAMAAARWILDTFWEAAPKGEAEVVEVVWKGTKQVIDVLNGKFDFSTLNKPLNIEREYRLVNDLLDELRNK